MSFPSYAETRTALLANETSCERLVSSFLERIERRNAELNLFCSVDADGALSRARELDAERARGVVRPLTGLVLGVKDVIATRAGETTCASRILQGFESLYDATAVRKLLEAGAIIIGKLNCDEFAMGSSNENSAFGPARNPHHLDYVPGGSSGGSAAAVAAGFCHAALGTDTGGSIRQPAAFCGVVGLKPTYGRVSRLGLVAYASSFDCMGPLALTADDAALLLGVMAGHDPWDSTSSPEPVPDYTRSLDDDIAGMRVGLPSEYFADGLDPHIRAEIGRTTDRLAARGAEILEISLPHTAYGIATYYVLVTAEASSNLARYDGVRYGYRSDLAAVRSAMHEAREQLAASVQEAEAAGDLEAAGTLQAELDEQESLLDGFYSQTRAEGFGAEVKRRILLGTYVLSAGYYDAYYLKAQKVRTLIRRDFENAFEQADVLLTPATPTTAFPLGSKLADPMEMYLSDIYTVTANLAGIPGLVVPLAPHPAPPHLPIGLQLLGPHFAEERLLRLGKWIMAGTAAKNG